MSERRRGIAPAAMMLSALAAVSALGLVRDITIAARFGAGASLDAYLVAQGLLNVVLGLLAGAMAKASVPVLACGVAQNDADGAHRTALVALSVTTLALALASLVMWLAAVPVVGVLAPGFGAMEEELAARLTRIVLIASVFIAGTNLLARGRSGASTVLLVGRPGDPVQRGDDRGGGRVRSPPHGVVALAVGYVVASAARFAAQLVPLRPMGLRLRPSLNVGARWSG